MGAKTKVVGGGAATGVADDWNNFLRQQLNNTQQPQMQSNNAFGNAFNQAMTGKVQDQNGSHGVINALLSDPTSMYANTNYGNTFTAPQLSQLPTNFGAGQTGMANLSGFGNAATSGFNTQGNLGGVGSGMDGTLNRLLQSGMNNMPSNGGFGAATAGADVSMTPQMSYQQAYDTLGQDPLLERNRMKAVADMRARFGAEGAGALGTGAQFAEGNLNAELAAQDASMRRAQSMQLMNQDLMGNRALADVGLQNRGQNMQTSIANMQGGLQGAQNMQNSLNSLLSSTLGARGQDLSTGLGMRGQNLDQLQLGAQQDMFNAGQMNDMQGQMLAATLQNQNLGNQFGLNSATLNNNAMQNNNLNALNSAQLNAQYGLGANQLNSNNQQFNTQALQNLLSQGMNVNQLGNQNMMAMLQGMFGNFQQSNALGTPQAQVIQQPSGWGQALNAGLGIGGAILGGPLGGMIGSSLGGMFGGTPQMPNVNVPTANVPLPQVNLNQSMFANAFAAPGLPQLYGGYR